MKYFYFTQETTKTNRPAVSANQDQQSDKDGDDEDDDEEDDDEEDYEIEEDESEGEVDESESEENPMEEEQAPNKKNSRPKSNLKASKTKPSSKSTRIPKVAVNDTVFNNLLANQLNSTDQQPIVHNANDAPDENESNAVNDGAQHTQASNGNVNHAELAQTSNGTGGSSLPARIVPSTIGGYTNLCAENIEVNIIIKNVHKKIFKIMNLF